MNPLLSGISQHGLAALFIVVFLEAIGIPLPAALALLIAGATSGRGLLRPELALGGSLIVMLCADNLLYFMGRQTGWWLMGILCRLSLNPESCILRTADKFYRRGRALLLFAKFLPRGKRLSAAFGRQHEYAVQQVRPARLAGAAIYIGFYWSIGFVFSNVLEPILRVFETFSRLVTWLAAAAVILYFAYQVRLWAKARALPTIPRMHPREVARIFYADGGASEMAIYDVRSHGYYGRSATRIRGSVRLEPNSLHQIKQLSIVKQTVLYCTCARQATSLPVARLLREQQLQCAVLAGGLRAWKKAGLPMEPVPREEIMPLPSFAA